MIKRLLDIAQDLPLFKNALSDKDREYIERFYGYICAGADKSRALGYYVYRADSGDILAYYIAGLCYHLDKDFHNARKFYEMLCDKSDLQSTFRHIDGSELLLDSNAIKTLKGVAYRRIGRMYDDGQGVAQDYKKAVELYQKSADLGDDLVYLNLGYMYREGLGVNQDCKKAIELYQKACDLGVDSAYFSLGYMYENGRGVNQDYNKAVKYYQKACDLGEAGAYNNLGVMYYEGFGVAVDKNKALQLYKKSCDMGVEQGCKNYRILKNEMGL